MTLFLLLVTIACLTPIVGVVVESSRLGPAGTVVGLVIALGLAMGQFIGHHALVRWMTAGERGARLNSWVVAAYYVSIPVCGAIIDVLTLAVARRF